jgi:hypothetical protein
MPNLVPKIVSILYLVTLLVAWSLSGWLDSPIRFYKSFYGAAVFTDIPQASQNALEHISVTMTQREYLNCWISGCAVQTGFLFLG